MKKGDIYYIDLKNKKGSEQGGYRPVIILNDVMKNDVIVASLTTKTKRQLPVHVKLFPHETGLEKESILLLEQLRPINVNELTKKIGSLNNVSRWDDINKSLKISLGL